MTIRDQHPSSDSLRHATISASIAVDIAILLRQSGVDPEPLFHQVGIDIQATYDPYQQVRFDRYTYLLHLAADALKRPLLGLELGYQQNPVKWGAFGYVVVHSPTVGIALENMSTFHKASQSDTHVACVQRGELFGVEYSVLPPKVTYKDQDAEFSMAYVKHVVDQLCNSTVEPKAIHFEHSPLAPLPQYLELMGITPEFDQPVNAILYPAKLAEQAVHSADLQLYPILRQHLIDRIEAMPDDFDLLATVAYHIRQYLPSQQYQLAQIARQLATSSRSLQRRLNEHGTSFAEQLELTRKALAIQYLQTSTMEVKEIGYLLGFGDSSGFIRAFKGWTGTTPSQYRNHQQP